MKASANSLNTAIKDALTQYKAVNVTLISFFIGAGLILFALFNPSASRVFTLAGLILIAVSFYLMWLTFVVPARQLKHWTQMIRAGDLGAQFKHEPIGEYVNIYQEMQFIGEMLQSLSRDAEKQVQKHTAHIAQKTRSLSILYEVASSINMSRSVDALLSQFLHTLTELIDAQAATAYLIKNDTEIELLTHINNSEEIISAHANLCLQNSHSASKRKEFAVLNLKLVECEPELKKKYFENQDVYILVVPLQYQKSLLGAYNFYLRKEALNDFDDYDELFTSIGRHLGAAIEKAHLDEETTALSIMRERTHIANELHDSLAQTLTSIRFQVRVLDETLHQGDDAQVWAEMEKIEASINEAHTEIRELIAHFRTPTVLVSLIASVELAIDRFRQVNDEIQVFFQNEWPETSLPADTEFHILRIVQESLTNIRKHSDAENVRIMMSGDDQGRYKVLIEDDGVGFAEPQTSIHSGEHIGLSIMQDRARRFGGTLQVESEPGEGTRIVLEFSLSSLPDQSTDQLHDELELARTHNR